MRFLQSLPRTLLASVLLLVGRSGADFTATTSFGNVTNGQPLLLAWDSIDPTNYPLYVTVQLIDRDSDGHSATGYKANITTGVAGSNFTWNDPPYPLRWVSSGLYSLEIHGSSSSGDGQALAKSPFFAIQARSGSTTASPSGSPNSTPTSAKSTSGSPSGIDSRTLAVALGVALGALLMISLAVAAWCCRGRYSKAAREQKSRLLEEKRRQLRKDFVID